MTFYYEHLNEMILKEVSLIALNDKFWFQIKYKAFKIENSKGMFLGKLDLWYSGFSP